MICLPIHTPVDKSHWSAMYKCTKFLLCHFKLSGLDVCVLDIFSKSKTSGVKSSITAAYAYLWWTFIQIFKVECGIECEFLNIKFNYSETVFKFTKATKLYFVEFVFFFFLFLSISQTNQAFLAASKVCPNRLKSVWRGVVIASTYAVYSFLDSYNTHVIIL